ncbi:hypothetical protein QF045_002866 [Pseudomonas sp. W4I3]|nr:hypothetical protein [Pseudomonas sp. W4I3]
MQLVFEVCEAAGGNPASMVRKIFDGVGRCDWPWLRL